MNQKSWHCNNRMHDSTVEHMLRIGSIFLCVATTQMSAVDQASVPDVCDHQGISAGTWFCLILCAATTLLEMQRTRAWSMAAWALPRTRSMYFWYSSWMCLTRMLWMRSNSATCGGGGDGQGSGFRVYNQPVQ